MFSCGKMVKTFSRGQQQLAEQDLADKRLLVMLKHALLKQRSQFPSEEAHGYKQKRSGREIATRFQGYLGLRAERRERSIIV